MADKKIDNHYTLETEKTDRTSTGFQHNLFYNGEFIEGSIDPEEFDDNPTKLSLGSYARLNEEILNLGNTKSIEVKFYLLK